MIRTKDFFIACIVVVSTILIVWFLTLDAEAPVVETNTKPVVILAEPEDFQILPSGEGNYHMKRVIFIEKVRNALKRAPAPTPTRETEVLEASPPTVESVTNQTTDTKPSEGEPLIATTTPVQNSGSTALEPTI